MDEYELCVEEAGDDDDGESSVGVPASAPSSLRSLRQPQAGGPHRGAGASSKHQTAAAAAPLPLPRRLSEDVYFRYFETGFASCGGAAEGSAPLSVDALFLDPATGAAAADARLASQRVSEWIRQLPSLEEVEDERGHSSSRLSAASDGSASASAPSAAKGTEQRSPAGDPEDRVPLPELHPREPAPARESALHHGHRASLVRAALMHDA